LYPAICRGWGRADKALPSPILIFQFTLRFTILNVMISKYIKDIKKHDPIPTREEEIELFKKARAGER
jgi:hypothetical protein